MGAQGMLEPLRELRRAPAAIPALLMVGVFVALSAADGGYFRGAFLPAALVGLGLLVMSLVAVDTRAIVPRTVALAAGLLAAYAVWSYLSILWSPDQGAALDGANRALMYAVIFALFGLWPLRGLPATIVLGAYGIGIAGLGMVTLIRAASAADVSEMLVSGRFTEPVGYVNGNVALWFSALLPCVFLAARRELWPPLRGLALGGAGLLGGLALLGQSRGWLVALPLALIVFLAIVPGRIRNAAALLAVAAALLLALDPILDVFSGIDDGADPAPLIDSAVWAILIAAGGLVLAGTAVAFLDRGTELSPRGAGRTRLAAGAALAALALAGVVVGVAALGDPLEKATDAWEDFKAGGEDEPTGRSRFTTVTGGNRYDFWRVALEEAGEQPLAGAGAGSFQNAYLREGQSVERPQFPHSLELRLLLDTGVVGALLFLAGACAALVAAAAAIRRRTGIAPAVAGTAVAVFAYWALHGSVDWFYELPAVGAPAFAMLGLAAGLAPRERLAGPRGRRSNALAAGPRTPLRLGVLVVCALLAAIALAAPWLSDMYVQRAVAGWPADPDGALRDLDRAAALDPLSIDPHAAAALIAVRLDRPATAREEFEAVLERDPDDTFATLELGALASESGRRSEAARRIRRARELSPRDALVMQAQDALERGERLDASELYDDALERRRALTGD